MLKIPGLNTYFGGKGASGTYQRIINHIRPHDTLLIPFAGNCAVTRAMRWPGRVLVNDLDVAVVAAWRAANLGTQLEVYNLPALDFIHESLQCPELGRVVIYCDPPYPLDSRKSQRLIYNHEMTDQQHREFLDAVRWLRVDCLVSTYPNDLYADQLSHWQRTEFQSQTRKVARWVARYRGMTPHEQQRILRQILENAPQELVKQLITLPSPACPFPLPNCATAPPILCVSTPTTTTKNPRPKRFCATSSMCLPRRVTVAPASKPV